VADEIRSVGLDFLSFERHRVVYRQAGVLAD
jgi:hypothetical protein